MWSPLFTVLSEKWGLTVRKSVIGQGLKGPQINRFWKHEVFV
jgi:hypothetical protein